MALGLEGAAIFYLAGSIVISIALFLILFGAFDFGIISAVVIAVLPTALVLALFNFLVRGKPKGYPEEFAEWLVIRTQQHLQTRGTRFFRIPRTNSHPKQR